MPRHASNLCVARCLIAVKWKAEWHQHLNQSYQRGVVLVAPHKAINKAPKPPKGIAKIVAEQSLLSRFASVVPCPATQTPKYASIAFTTQVKAHDYDFVRQNCRMIIFRSVAGDETVVEW